jgi:hypothetical protein
MALDNKHSGWMPLCAVAALVQRGDTVLPPLDGGVFAFTPVEPSGLPVHVNAWFEVNNNGIVWKRSDSESEDTVFVGDEAALAWNTELVSCSVDAYLDLLKALFDLIKNDPVAVYR